MIFKTRSEHWPLPDGSCGLMPQELWDSQPGDSRTDATRHRNAMLQTSGNLTILTQALNSPVSNNGWQEKKPALLSASLLPKVPAILVASRPTDACDSNALMLAREARTGSCVSHSLARRRSSCSPWTKSRGSSTTVRAWLVHGRLRGFKLTPKVWRFRYEDFQAFGAAAARHAAPDEQERVEP
jgi:hypothetical protein